MDISVIVPIYGVEKFIEKSLRSLFSQTKTEGVEFILVNDQTKDRSIEIAREVIADFPTLDIKIIEHETNQGVAAARQSGMDAASGDYTIHFDPDDWCDPEMLEELFDCAVINKSDIVVCNYIREFQNREELKVQKISESKIDNIRLLISEKLYGSLWNKLIKRELYSNNGIKFIPNVNNGEDLLMCIMTFNESQKIIHLDKAFYHYIQRGSSILHTATEQPTSPQPKIGVIEYIESILGSDIAIYTNEIMWRKIYPIYGSIRRRELNKTPYIYPEAINYINSHPKLHFIQKTLCNQYYKNNKLLVHIINLTLDMVELYLKRLK